MLSIITLILVVIVTAGLGHLLKNQQQMRRQAQADRDYYAEQVSALRAEVREYRGEQRALEIVNTATVPLLDPREQPRSHRRLWLVPPLAAVTTWANEHPRALVGLIAVTAAVGLLLPLLDGPERHGPDQPSIAAPPGVWPSLPPTPVAPPPPDVAPSPGPPMTVVPIRPPDRPRTVTPITAARATVTRRTGLSPVPVPPAPSPPPPAIPPPGEPPAPPVTAAPSPPPAGPGCVVGVDLRPVVSLCLLGG